MITITLELCILAKLQPREFYGYRVYAWNRIENIRTGKVIKPFVRYGRDKKLPYFRVCLYCPVRKFFTVSRLRAELFFGGTYGMEVDHLDHDTCNNGLDNLEVVTAEENQKRRRDRQ